MIETFPGCHERKVDLKRKTAAEVVSAAVLFYGVRFDALSF